MELALGRFLQALGHGEVLAAGHFGHGPRLRPVAELLNRDKEQEFVEFCATDRSLNCTIDTDYHYYLICQTEAGLTRARPEDFFEGFYAEKETNDFWGVGRFGEGEAAPVRAASAGSCRSGSGRSSGFSPGGTASPAWCPGR
ncbi:hypothetical protein GCM10010961_36430 [Pseudodonghicola xiamenensis]|uniref:Uncharacterized protein n=1 Tax=Pseudodonghicola xiamenensis TaxID=337702 RepID=A0A8J3H8F2_9RHOB|nr:hypothetical protein GCM10010961_36430 [Pseudodonghicola xiamenensis]